MRDRQISKEKEFCSEGSTTVLQPLPSLEAAYLTTLGKEESL